MRHCDGLLCPPQHFWFLIHKNQILCVWKLKTSPQCVSSDERLKVNTSYTAILLRITFVFWRPQQREQATPSSTPDPEYNPQNKFPTKHPHKQSCGCRWLPDKPFICGLCSFITAQATTTPGNKPSRSTWYKTVAWAVLQTALKVPGQAHRPSQGLGNREDTQGLFPWFLSDVLPNMQVK